MGIDYNAKVMYGFWMEDIKDGDLREEILEVLDLGYLEYAAPYYDAGENEWFVGLDVPMFNLTNEQAIAKIMQIVEESKDNELMKKVADSGVQLVVNCNLNVY